ncbi:heat shock factor protein 4 isoform X1 [Synchiropus splendidus]|uniref:heat shock factor protein 4 isoform X1 n=1 Tax=Synchiropus splendidus TaxID=270530 RepID=UPI00237E77E5|nr:heat shock factor protein 4 isoform X1 [Synchiropus splendidus]
MQESPGAVGGDGNYASNVPAFLTKLWTLVEDPDTNHLICWSSTGTSFHVFDQGRFAKEVLPKYFKHNNMASFVRQLNMYGFRKVVNIEQSGLVKPERDDTEFQHLYFLQGHEHMLEHIKRKVSIVKSEDTKVRQEDLSKLLYEVQLLRTQQDNMECQMQDMKQQNEVLWREVVSLRQNHAQQQKVMNKLIQFLFSQMPSNTPATAGLKRKLPLMLDDGPIAPPASKLSHNSSMEPPQEPFYIQSPASDTSSTPSGLTGGPIISDVTDISQASASLQMQSEESRDKCLMLIKEEPVSPEVRAAGKAPGGDAVVLTSTCGVCSSEPPVLPVAMVQSVLEGRASSASVERRSKRVSQERLDPGHTVENDMSLDELQQLLLRSHQHGSMEAGPSAAMDPFTLGLPLADWTFSEMESNLKSYMFQSDEAEAFPAATCEEQ